MRVALDARMIDHSGIGAAIEGWFEGFAALEKSERPALTLLGNPMRLAMWAASLEADVIPFPAAIYSFAEQVFFPRSRGRWDLLHVPHYAHPVMYSGPMAVTVHDLFHVKFGKPWKAAYQRLMLAALKARGRFVFTDSEGGRAELIEQHGFAAERLAAVPLGISQSLVPLRDQEEAEEFRRRHALPSRYLLWTGIDQPHKNLGRLIRVLARLHEERRLDAPVVLATPSAKSEESIAARLTEIGAPGWASILPRIPRAEMPALYAGAIGLVVPSLEEGFGLPPLEAMALETPVAIADRPAMNEICADATLRFDPENEEEMGEAVLRLVGDETLRQELIESGKRRVRQYRSDAAARRLIEAYRRAL